MAEANFRLSVAVGRESMLLALTWVAGAVDAISFLGLGHVFTAMMTGNVVLLGLALAQGEVLAALRSIVALVSFGIGVFAGAVIVERDSEPAVWPAVVTGALAVEAAVLGVFLGISLVAAAPRAGGIAYLLVALLALAMGIQSAAVRRLGVPGIATTYITGTLTSLMVHLLRWLRSIAVRLPIAERGSGERSPTAAWEQRVGLLTAVITFYCFGAFVGGVLETRSSPLATFIPAVIVLLVVVNTSIRHHHDKRGRR